eukprot:6175091-Pleurochrysis_carterae.AAC.1
MNFGFDDVALAPQLCELLLFRGVRVRKSLPICRCRLRRRRLRCGALAQPRLQRLPLRAQFDEPMLLRRLGTLGLVKSAPQLLNRLVVQRRLQRHRLSRALSFVLSRQFESEFRDVSRKESSQFLSLRRRTDASDKLQRQRKRRRMNAIALMCGVRTANEHVRSGNGHRPRISAGASPDFASRTAADAATTANTAAAAAAATDSVVAAARVCSLRNGGYVSRQNANCVDAHGDERQPAKDARFVQFSRVSIEEQREQAACADARRAAEPAQRRGEHVSPSERSARRMVTGPWRNAIPIGLIPPVGSAFHIALRTLQRLILLSLFVLATLSLRIVWSGCRQNAQSRVLGKELQRQQLAKELEERSRPGGHSMRQVRRRQQPKRRFILTKVAITAAHVSAGAAAAATALSTPPCVLRVPDTATLRPRYA